jgi:TorA maturation chaperone TorD
MQHLFKITQMRLLSPTSCEVYMQDHTTHCLKGWIVECQAHLAQQFYEQINQLSQAAEPFQALLYLKQFYKVDVIR